ncbi:MAG: cupin domain-containing protein [bacterium]|nr:cupin domain-containing protein [bacterium]
MFYTANPDGYHELLPGVRLKTLVHGERMHFTEVKFVKGAKVPMHKHPHEQTGYVVKGALRFDVDGEILIAKPGDSWNIASNVPHSAEALEETAVIEVFSPVREDYLAMM